MNGHEVRRLPRHRLPGLAGVGALVKLRLAAVSRADINRSRGFARRAGGGVENNKAQAGTASTPEEIATFRRGAPTFDRKVFHLVPGQRGVLADPKSVVSRTEVKNVVVVGVNGQTFADAATAFVAAHVEGHVNHLKSFALIHRTKNCRRVARVHTLGEIQTIGINRVGRETFGAVQIGITAPVGEREPAFGPAIPLVGTADVGAAINQPRLFGVEDDAGNESAGHHFHVLPHVWPRRHISCLAQHRHRHQARRQTRRQDG